MKRTKLSLTEKIFTSMRRVTTNSLPYKNTNDMKSIAFLPAVLLLLCLAPLGLIAQPPSMANVYEGDGYLEYTLENEVVGEDFVFSLNSGVNYITKVVIEGTEYTSFPFTIPNFAENDITVKEYYENCYYFTNAVEIRRIVQFGINVQKTFNTNIFFSQLKFNNSRYITVESSGIQMHHSISIEGSYHKDNYYIEVVEPGLVVFSDNFDFTLGSVNFDFMLSSTVSTYFVRIYADDSRTNMLYSLDFNVDKEQLNNKKQYIDYYVDGTYSESDKILYCEFERENNGYNSSTIVSARNSRYPLLAVYKFPLGTEVLPTLLNSDNEIGFTRFGDNYEFNLPNNYKYILAWDMSSDSPTGHFLITNILWPHNGLSETLYFGYGNNEISIEPEALNDLDSEVSTITFPGDYIWDGSNFSSRKYSLKIKNETPVKIHLRINDLSRGSAIWSDGDSFNQDEIVIDANQSTYLELEDIYSPESNIAGFEEVNLSFEYPFNSTLSEGKIESWYLKHKFISISQAGNNCAALTIKKESNLPVEISLLAMRKLGDYLYFQLKTLEESGFTNSRFQLLDESPLTLQCIENTSVAEDLNIKLNIRSGAQILGYDCWFNNDVVFESDFLHYSQLNSMFPSYKVIPEQTTISPAQNLKLKSSYDFTTDFSYGNVNRTIFPASVNAEYNDDPAEQYRDYPKPEGFTSGPLEFKLYYEHGGDKCYVLDEHTFVVPEIGISFCDEGEECGNICPQETVFPRLAYSNNSEILTEEVSSVQWILREGENNPSGEDITAEYLTEDATAKSVNPLARPELRIPDVSATLYCVVTFVNGNIEQTSEVIPLETNLPQIIGEINVGNVRCPNEATPTGAINFWSTAQASLYSPSGYPVIGASLYDETEQLWYTYGMHLQQGTYTICFDKGDASCPICIEVEVGMDFPEINSRAIVQTCGIDDLYCIFGAEVDLDAGETVSFVFQETDKIGEETEFVTATEASPNVYASFIATANHDAIIGNRLNSNFQIRIEGGQCSGSFIDVDLQQFVDVSAVANGGEPIEFCTPQRVPVSVNCPLGSSSVEIDLDMGWQTFDADEDPIVAIGSYETETEVFGNTNVNVRVADGSNKLKGRLYLASDEGKFNGGVWKDTYTFETNYDVTVWGLLNEDDITVTITNPECNSTNPVGSFYVTVPGSSGRGMEYQWRDESNTLYYGRYVDNLPPGIYYLTVVDGFCNYTSNEFLYEIEEPSPNFDALISNTACGIGGSIHSIRASKYNSGVDDFIVEWSYIIENQNIPIDNMFPFPIEDGRQVLLQKTCRYNGGSSFGIGLISSDLFAAFQEGGYYEPTDMHVLQKGTYVARVLDKYGCEVVTNTLFYDPPVLNPQTRNFALMLRWSPAQVNSLRKQKEWSPPFGNPNGEPGADPLSDLIKGDNSEIGYENCVNIINANRNSFIESVVGNVDDEIVISQDIEQKYFTLYYYDRVGNLVKTIPPEGVRLGTPAGADPVANPAVEPEHFMATHYEYNTLGQLVSTVNPDHGMQSDYHDSNPADKARRTTHFAYDLLGKLLFSQNPQQKANGTFSYSKYDRLGRILETGEASFGSAAPGGSTIADFDDLKSFAIDYVSVQGQNYYSLQPGEQYPTDDSFITTRTITTYSTPSKHVSLEGKVQTYLQNRIASVRTIDEQGFESAIHYSYDVHGNVKWIANEVPEIGLTFVEYEYDVLSGNVLKAIFHGGNAGKFYHKYEYDASNRLLGVETSTDGIIWSKEAEYDYYEYGPLSSVILGHEKVQEMNYRYTIQGWLKAINSNSESGANGNIPADAFAMTLGYYNGDFVRSGSPDLNGTNIQAQLETPYNMYGGNIAAWTWTSPTDQAGTMNTQAMDFKYDILQRIKQSNITRDLSQPSITSSLTNYSYDLNGNLKTLNRYDANGAHIDNLSYTYFVDGNGMTLKNRLMRVSDAQSTTSYEGDFEGTSNYMYDNIGNLKSDASEGIAEIRWNVAGKVSEIIPELAANANNQKAHIKFVYDPLGNRILKQVNADPQFSGGTLIKEGAEQFGDMEKVSTTYYSRDASGNHLATFERKNELIYQEEINGDIIFYKPSGMGPPPASNSGFSVSFQETQCITFPESFSITSIDAGIISAELIIRFTKPSGAYGTVVYVANQGDAEFVKSSGSEHECDVSTLNFYAGNMTGSNYASVSATIQFAPDPKLQSFVHLVENPLYGSSRLGMLKRSELFAVLETDVSDYNHPTIIDNGPKAKTGADKLVAVGAKTSSIVDNGIQYSVDIRDVLELDADADKIRYNDVMLTRYSNFEPRFTASATQNGGSQVFAVVGESEGSSRKMLLYGPQGNILPLLDDMHPLATFTQPCITPVPGKDQSYYVYTTKSGNYNNGANGCIWLFYSEINASGNGGKGSIVESRFDQFLHGYDYSETGAIAAVTDQEKKAVIVFMLVKDNESGELNIVRQKRSERAFSRVFGGNTLHTIPTGIEAIAQEGTRLRVSPDGKYLAVLYPTSPAKGWFPNRQHAVTLIPLKDGFSITGMDNAITLSLEEYTNSKNITMEFTADSKQLLVGQELLSGGSANSLVFDVETGQELHSYGIGGQFVRAGNGFLYYTQRNNGDIGQVEPGRNLDAGNSIPGLSGYKGLSAVSAGMHMEPDTRDPYTFGSRVSGLRQYELNDHLGNVRVIVSDQKGYNQTTDEYEYDVVFAEDYYPFGMNLKGLSFDNQSLDDYRFGFNGMEKDDEIKGDGNSYTTLFRQYDPRIGRWMSIDPMMAKFPSLSPYNFSFNNPVLFTDPFGDEPVERYGKVRRLFNWAIGNKLKNEINRIAVESGADESDIRTYKNILRGRVYEVTVWETYRNQDDEDGLASFEIAEVTYSYDTKGGIRRFDYSFEEYDKPIPLFISGEVLQPTNHLIIGVAPDVTPGRGRAIKGVVSLLKSATWRAPAVKAFEKAGIKYTEHFATRVSGRASRGISGRKALDAYNKGRLYYNPATKNYIRHNARTRISVVTDKKVGGKAITVFEGKASPDWVPVRFQ